MSLAAQANASPHWSTRPLTLIIGGLCALMWVFLFPRFLALLLLAAYMIASMIPSIRRSRYVSLSFLMLALAAGWSPLDVAFTRVAHGPKILACCPGAPYLDYENVLRRQQRGECMFCGDLAGPNGIPHWYLVW